MSATILAEAIGVKSGNVARDPMMLRAVSGTRVRKS